MDEVNQKIDMLLQQLSQEGVLNDQFQQLMQLQDETNPDFVKEVVELYFQDSAQKLEKLQGKISESQPDFAEIDALVHQFKGSSASFGANTLAQQCIQLREACHMQDRQRCQALLDGAKTSYTMLKGRLDVFLQLENQRKQMLLR